MNTNTDDAQSHNTSSKNNALETEAQAFVVTVPADENRLVVRATKHTWVGVWHDDREVVREESGTSVTAHRTILIRNSWKI